MVRIWPAFPQAGREFPLQMGNDLEGVDAAPAPAPPAPGERLQHLLHSITFGILALLLVFLIFSSVLSLQDYVNRLVLQSLAAGLSDAALLLESWFFLTVADGREFQSLGLSLRPGWIKELSVGLGTGAALMGAVIGIMVFAHVAQYSGVMRHPGGGIAPLAATGLFLLLAAALEEIGFRGYAFQRLVDATGAFGAVAISSFLFGLGHFGNPAATPLSTANTALAGAVMALGYLRTRGLWFPIGLHFAWNFVLGPIASFPVSGIGLISVFNVRVAGPVWLTGGGYGPEGSVILTVVCLGGIALLGRGSGIVSSRRGPDAVE
jgi:membrane protease YdiL (CAAX protease family)